MLIQTLTFMSRTSVTIFCSHIHLEPFIRLFILCHYLFYLLRSERLIRNYLTADHTAGSRFCPSNHLVANVNGTGVIVSPSTLTIIKRTYRFTNNLSNCCRTRSRLLANYRLTRLHIAIMSFGSKFRITQDTECLQNSRLFVAEVWEC